jgi:AhpD family alkylhydroperoxidase
MHAIARRRGAGALDMAQGGAPRWALSHGRNPRCRSQPPDWKAFLTDTNAELAQLRPAMPGASTGFAQLAQAATAPGAFDPKTKKLIAFSIGIATRCDGCIGFHVKAAIRPGAARNEVCEVIALCVYMRGGPSMMHGVKALAAYDQLSEE